MSRAILCVARVVPVLISVCVVPAVDARPTPPPTTQGGIGAVSVPGILGTPGVQPPRDIQTQTGQSIVRGRIIGTDTGQPLRRALVRITGANLRGLRSTLTDADGRYEFTGLPAGSFTVTADKPAYAAWTFGQTQPLTPGKPVVVTANQIVDNVDIRLPRGAVISGRILDEFGDPVPDVQVAPLRTEYMNGQRHVVQSGRIALTNDIGEYRLYGLGTGQYMVSATLRGPLFVAVAANGSAGPVQGAEDRTGYAPTYYPGTPDLHAATKIAVAAGQTRAEVNFSLSAARTATISGIVVDAEGRPFSGRGVTAIPRGGSMVMATAPIDAGGLFTVPSVPPGEYRLQANVPRPPAPPGAQVDLPEISMAFVTVNGSDVTGVRLAPLSAVRVSGRVTFEDQSAAQAVTPSAVRITLTQVSLDFAGVPMAVPSTTVHDDLTFQMNVLPGQYAVRASLMISATVSRSGTGSASIAAAPNMWTVKSIRLRGSQIIDSGLSVGADEIADLDIELTNRTSLITGQVTDSGGVVKDYVTLFFAQDRNRWTSAANRYVAVGRPDQDGRFKITSLPPGEYYAIALDRADPGEYQDPDFLENVSRQATTVSLAEGESRTVDLRLFTLQ
jgi:protocatechuate 3,4-dioxygenase beta subunit